MGGSSGGDPHFYTSYSQPESNFLDELASFQHWKTIAGDTRKKTNPPYKKAMDHLVDTGWGDTMARILYAMAIPYEMASIKHRTRRNDYHPLKTVAPFPNILMSMAAVIFDHDEALRFFLGQPLLPVDAHNGKGWTTLQVAAYLKKEKAVHILLDAGANPFCYSTGIDGAPSAYDSFPQAVESHPFFRRHLKEKQRALQQHEKKQAFLENQKKLQSFAQKKPEPAAPAFRDAAMPKTEVVPSNSRNPSEFNIKQSLIVIGAELYCNGKNAGANLADYIVSVADHLELETLDTLMDRHEHKLDRSLLSQLQERLEESGHSAWAFAVYDRGPPRKPRPFLLRKNGR